MSGASASHTVDTSSPDISEKSPPRKVVGEVRPIRLTVSVAIGVILWVVPIPEGLADNAWHLFAIFFATIVAIIMKAAPMGSLSVVAMALCAGTQVLAPGDIGESINAALSGFSNATIWLIVSAFFVARSVVKSGLGERLAYLFVRVFGKSTIGLAYGLGLTDLALSPFIPSNTARAGGIVYPITKAIAEQAGSHTEDPATHRKVGSYLALTGYNMDLAVSVIFLTGAAPNAMAVQLAMEQGVDISWTGWFLAALIPGVVGVLLVPIILYFTYPPEVKRTPDAPQHAAAQLKELGKVTRAEWTTLAVFVLIIALWVFGGDILNATTVALIGLSALLIGGALTWEDMKAEKAAWDTLVWFAALVMMGTYLNTTGFISWFGDGVGGWLEEQGMGHLLAFVALTAVYALSHYLFASGTAHAASMFAVFLAVGLALGLPGVPLVVFLGVLPTIMGCLTHYGNGPAPIYFGSGYVELRAWWINGLIIGVMHLVIWLTIGIAWWNIIGVW
ncbi:MAG: anion permease [Ancrocorticia sp.]|uniref:anion permease n=1 Tax=Ancrocorticia sp. TaxID=2593684 RepID=UPI003F8E1CAC